MFSPSRFFYPSQFDFIEDVEGYKTGGFHPVAIGDDFAGGCYRVVHKLGYGGSSTIWLARTRPGKLVALKVLRADVSSERFNELPELVVPLRLSEYIQARGPVACSKIQVPEDYFMEKGPNGSHLCLVYQLAGPSILSISGAMTGGRLRKDLAKKVAKQLVCAVALLHAVGFVHGGSW
jgi:serine/threonine-protein kinase SRPK3